jgi:hypothetical protein
MIVDYITKNPTCFYEKNGYIEIFIKKPAGQVSISWYNLPRESKILANGRIVKNLGIGDYKCEVTDGKSEPINLVVKLKKNLPPSIDFIVLDKPKCANGVFGITVFINGGIPPYRIKFAEHNVLTYNNEYYIDNILPNIEGTLSVMDNDGCFTIYDKSIDLTLEPIKLDVIIDEPKKHGDTANKVEYVVSGGVPPYKIQWMDEDNNLIAKNQFVLDNTLKAGYYRVIISDSNNCLFSSDFIIEEPSPLSLDYSIEPDASFGQYYDPTTIYKINNLLVFNKTHELSKLNLGDKIIVYNNKTKDKYELPIIYVNDNCDSINIDGKEMKYLYVGMGLLLNDIERIPNNENYVLKLNDQEIPLSLVPKKNSVNFLIGSFILDNNYSFAFKSQDKVRVLLNDKDYLDINIDAVYSEFGYYINSVPNTVIMFLCNNNYKLLNTLNNYDENIKDIKIYSLTNKKIKTMGSLNVRINNGFPRIHKELLLSKKYYQCKLWKEDRLIFDGEVNHIDKITDLDKGLYQLEIYDNNNQYPFFINGLKNSKQLINVEIPDIETQKFNLLSTITKNTKHHNNGIKLQENNYTYNNILCCLSVVSEPHYANINITGPKKFKFDGQGHQYFDNLSEGVYTIKFSCKGYRSITKTIKVDKNKLNTVSIALGKENNNASV